jgi:hypothetical protein
MVSILVELVTGLRVKDPLVNLVDIAVTFGIATLTISAVFEQSIGESLSIAMLIAMTIITTLAVVRWLRGMIRRGQVLLDCGPLPTRWIYILTVPILAFGVYSLVDYLSAHPDLSEISRDFHRLLFGDSDSRLNLLLPLFAVHALILGLGHLQIRDNGIWVRWGLIKWNDIHSYRWADDGEPKLMLEVNATFPYRERASLSIATKYKDDVDELLKSRVEVVT